MQGQLDEIVADRRPFVGIDPSQITINSPLTFGANGPSINFDMWLKNTGKSAAIHATAIVSGFHLEPFMPSGVRIPVKELINLYSKLSTVINLLYVNTPDGEQSYCRVDALNRLSILGVSLFHQRSSPILAPDWSLYFSLYALSIETTKAHFMGPGLFCSSNQPMEKIPSNPSVKFLGSL